jgi:hypothetical protein
MLCVRRGNKRNCSKGSVIKHGKQVAERNAVARRKPSYAYRQAGRQSWRWKSRKPSLKLMEKNPPFAGGVQQKRGESAIDYELHPLDLDAGGFVESLEERMMHLFAGTP